MAPPVVRSLWRSWPEHACFAVRRALHPGGWRAVIRRLFLGAVERDWWFLLSWLEWSDRRLRPVAGVRKQQRRRWRIGAASRRMVQLDSVSEPFVDFGLQYEPEANTDVYGVSYANQADALEAILASLPGGWRVLVKENPRQRCLRRSGAFYQRLMRDPRLSFVPDATPAAALLDRCAVAASLAGTLGYESIQRGRASVYFGDPCYAGLPGTVRFVPGLDWQAVSQQRVAPEELNAALKQRPSGAADGVVVPRYDALLTNSQGWRSEAQRTALSLASISRAVEKPEDSQWRPKQLVRAGNRPIAPAAN